MSLYINLDLTKVESRGTYKTTYFSPAKSDEEFAFFDRLIQQIFDVTGHTNYPPIEVSAPLLGISKVTTALSSKNATVPRGIRVHVSNGSKTFEEMPNTLSEILLVRSGKGTLSAVIEGKKKEVITTESLESLLPPSMLEKSEPVNQAGKKRAAATADAPKRTKKKKVSEPQLLEEIAEEVKDMVKSSTMEKISVASTEKPIPEKFAKETTEKPVPENFYKEK